MAAVHDARTARPKFFVLIVGIKCIEVRHLRALCAKDTNDITAFDEETLAGSRRYYDAQNRFPNFDIFRKTLNSFLVLRR